MVQPSEELFRCLLGFMKQQDELMDSLLQVGGQQQDALRANDIGDLDSAVTAINELAHRLAGLEEERLGVQQEVELHLGLPEKSTLQALLPFVETAALKDQLEDCRRLLRDKTELFREQNRINRLMLKNAIRFNNHMLKTLLPPEETYAGDGTVTGSRANTLVNKTI